MFPRTLALALAGLAFGLAPADGDRISRLADLGRVWGAVKLFHPYLVSRDVAWDEALVKAVPRVTEARNELELREALNAMLSTLGDPNTRIADAESPQHVDLAAAPPLATIDGVLVITVRVFPTGSAWAAEKSRIVTAIDSSSSIVVDLRLSPDDFTSFRAWQSFEQIDDELASRAVVSPAQQVRMWDGFPPQGGSTSGGFRSGLMLVPGKRYVPRQPGTRRVVFVTGPTDGLDDIALALVASGDGAVIGHGGVPLIGWTARLPTRPGLVLQLAGSDLGFDVPTTVVPSADDPIAAAIKLATRAPQSAATRPASVPIERPENAYPEMTAPSLEYRLLALFRYWNAIEYFYPYKHLIPDWEPVLAEEIPKFESATTARAYADAVQRLLTRVPDGHSSCGGHPDVPTGREGVPAEIRLVEGKPVVTRIDDPRAAAGLAVGDVVVSVDGEPAASLMKRIRERSSGSTEVYRDQAAARWLLTGTPGSGVDVVVAGEGGTRTVKLTRVALGNGREGESYKLLAPDIGYVDMTRLTVPEVPDMFRAFADTKGIIFDMRGYPQGTAWSMAPYLNTKNAKVACLVRRASYVGPPSGDRSFTSFDGALPTGTAPLYRGATVMLIDDRAISQAEFTGLFFEVAAGTRFVGTSSAGANGDVTWVVLPGGLRVAFTGQDIRHADGRQLQRVGLQPHLTVEPTLAGIRAGRDEVLEKGVEFLRGLVR
jgi:C-terminal processing protease CtpA/Prc